MNKGWDCIGNEAIIEDRHLIAIHKDEERIDVACSVSWTTVQDIKIVKWRLWLKKVGVALLECLKNRKEANLVDFNLGTFQRTVDEVYMTEKQLCSYSNLR
jgi:uncharacterized metal-binding protein